MTALAELLISPLDRARSAFISWGLRVGLLRTLALKKARRVPALLLGHALLALVLALLAPAWLLVVGPLLLGVPHLVSDVRHLVIRPALPGLARPLLLGGSALLLGARALEEAGVRGMERVELGLAGVLLFAAIVLARRASTAPPARVAGAAVFALALSGAALAWPREARLLLGHGHNVVALLLWAAFYRRGKSGAVWVVTCVLGIAALLVLSPLAWFGFQHGAQSAFGLHSLAAADTLAPGVSSVPLALGIVASFAFLQAVHYAVWLHAIPQDATRGDATLTFRMSWRALGRDFGPWLLLGIMGLVLLVPLAGMVAPLPTKSFYLSLSSFHGYLELAAAALFFVSGKGPLQPPS